MISGSENTMPSSMRMCRTSGCRVRFCKLRKSDADIMVVGMCVAVGTAVGTVVGLAAGAGVGVGAAVGDKVGSGVMHVVLLRSQGPG